MIRILHKAKGVFPECPRIAAVAAHFGVVGDVIVPKNEQRKEVELFKNSNPENTWEMMEKLGEGGFSEIYKVKNRETKEIAVTKVIFNHDENFEIFKTEFDVLSRIKHKNIVKIIEAYAFEYHLWVIF